MFRFVRASPSRWGRHVRDFWSPIDNWQRYVEGAKQVYHAYKIVTLPLTVPGALLGVAKLHNYWNPDDYARWYLRWVSAGSFQEPQYEAPWVQNAAMTAIVQAALKAHPNREQLTLISGLQMCGKTSGVLMECKAQKRRGFFVNLGQYKRNPGDGEREVEAYVVESLVANETVHHNAFQRVARLFFPTPEPVRVLAGFTKAFKAGNLVLVVDEVQKLANEHVLADAIMNKFCEVSHAGPVVLVASEYNVPLFFKKMTHIEARTRRMYAPTATAEEMLPYARERFGDEAALRIVAAFDGAFGLLQQLGQTGATEVGVQQVQAAHKQRIVYNLDLTKDGMKSTDRATRSGEAMIAAAELAFGTKPVDPFNKGTLELAQAGAAKIESLELGKERAFWAAPATESIMKEVLCDEAIHAIMKRRMQDDLYNDFKQAIEGKCPLQKFAA